MVPPRYLRDIQSPRVMTPSEWEPTLARRSFDFEVMIKQVAKVRGLEPHGHRQGVRFSLNPLLTRDIVAGYQMPQVSGKRH